MQETSSCTSAHWVPRQDTKQGRLGCKSESLAPHCLQWLQLLIGEGLDWSALLQRHVWVDDGDRGLLSWQGEVVYADAVRSLLQNKTTIYMNITPRMCDVMAKIIGFVLTTPSHYSMLV